MSLHPSAFLYLRPTDEQAAVMAQVREGVHDDGGQARRTAAGGARQDLSVAPATRLRHVG